MEFKNELLRDLINEIALDNEKEGDVCLISRIKIDDRNKITLPCGHKFICKYLLRTNKGICPYCNYSFELLACKNKCLKCDRETYLDIKLCTFHNKVECTKILKSGKKCTKSISNGDHCYLHQP